MRVVLRGVVLRTVWATPSRVLPTSPRMSQLSNRAAPASAAAAATSPTELWHAIVDRYNAANAAAVATLTDTSTLVLADGGIAFVLKVATTLRDKPKAPPVSGPKKEWKNPFLPPDADLFVCHLSAAHSLVLNKFNVVPHHGLVVTRDFHPQEEPLTAADFDATWKVIQAMPQGGLAYFNCGPESGASQPHKHVQVVPLPLVPDAPAAGDPPFLPAIAAAAAAAAAGVASPSDGIVELRALPCVGFLARVDASAASGERLAAAHAALVARAQHAAGVEGATMSYNMVMTREFILVAPRRRESAGPVSCNAMAFAGSFFVRSAGELEFIHAQGPMHVLSEVGVPWSM